VDHSTERAILGALLLENSLWPRTARLSIEDFSLDSNHRIFATMAAMFEDQRPVDPVTLTGELDRLNQLDTIGGPAYLASLVDGVVPENFDTYVRSVIRAAQERRINRQIELLTITFATQSPEKMKTFREQTQELLNSLDAAASSEHSIRKADDILDIFTLNIKPVSWLVDGLIPVKTLTILAGEGGAGKTWLTLDLARSIVLGGKFLDRTSQKMPVVILDRENPAAIMRERAELIFKGPAPGLHIWGTWLPDQPPLIGDRRLLELAKDEPLIVFDSLLRFHCADENSATEMKVVMGYLRDLVTAGATVLVLHHRSKSESSTYRGSSDIINGADVGFALAKTPGDLLTLKTIKHRFAQDITITIRPDFSVGRLYVVDSPAVTQKRDDVAAIREAIEAKPGMNLTELTRELRMGRTRTLDMLKNFEGKHWRSEPNNRQVRCYFPILLQ
jgi:AAA domain/DnaB-like helicase N terminal domain